MRFVRAREMHTYLVCTTKLFAQSRAQVPTLFVYFRDTTLLKEPGEWQWSSLRHYSSREIGIVEIESEWTARDREAKTCDGLARVFLHPEPALSPSKG